MDEHRQKLLAHPWRAAALWLLGSCAALLLSGNVMALVVVQSALVFHLLGIAWWLPFTLVGLGAGFIAGTAVFWRFDPLFPSQAMQFAAAGGTIGLLVGSMQWLASLLPGSRLRLPGLWWVLASILGVGAGYPVFWDIYTRVYQALLAEAGPAAAPTTPDSWIEAVGKWAGITIGGGLIYGLATAIVLYSALTHAQRAASAGNTVQ
ncbi:MAG: hypothetical protein HGA45_26560 [Chloroflexales bacterium]|nr:hypothetical protein [Chloroflexales bacterium]